MISDLPEEYMEERINKDEKEYKKFNKNSWILTIGGFSLLAMGVFKFFFLQPSFGINLKTQQPVVINGSLFIIIGICFTIIGFYRLIDKEKTFKEQQKLENRPVVNDEKKRKEKKKQLNN